MMRRHIGVCDRQRGTERLRDKTARADPGVGDLDPALHGDAQPPTKMVEPFGVEVRQVSRYRLQSAAGAKRVAVLHCPEVSHRPFQRGAQGCAPSSWRSRV